MDAERIWGGADDLNVEADGAHNLMSGLLFDLTWAVGPQPNRQEISSRRRGR